MGGTFTDIEKLIHQNSNTKKDIMSVSNRKAKQSNSPRVIAGENTKPG